MTTINNIRIVFTAVRRIDEHGYDDSKVMDEVTIDTDLDIIIDALGVFNNMASGNNSAIDLNNAKYCSTSFVVLNDNMIDATFKYHGTVTRYTFAFSQQLRKITLHDVVLALQEEKKHNLQKIIDNAYSFDLN